MTPSLILNALNKFCPHTVAVYPPSAFTMSAPCSPKAPREEEEEEEEQVEEGLVAVMAVMAVSAAEAAAEGRTPTAHLPATLGCRLRTSCSTS